MAEITPAGVDPAGIRNIIGNQINPATSEDVTALGSVIAGSFGLVIPQSDAVYATYPSVSSELYTFKRSGVTVATLLVTYSDSTKSTLLSAVVT